MKKYVTVCLILIIISVQFIHAQNEPRVAMLKIPTEYLPDTAKWDFKGVDLTDVNAKCYQPHGVIQAEWDSINKTYGLIKHDRKVFRLNTFDEENSLPMMDYGQLGGDYLMTKIIDIRKFKNPYITFLYQRAGIINPDFRTGWSDTCFMGPEHRVIKDANYKLEIRKPDQLLVEFISADSAHLDLLANPKEEDWNVHPRHGGLPPVTGNPALSIFGGGGYRVGFYEKDKDSALTFDDGLRGDYFDVGNDDRFERAFVTIPDTFVQRGFIKIRFRVDAERNGDKVYMPDDNDDFYIDDINIVQQGKPDVALNSVYIQNPYSMLGFNTKYAIPVYVNLSSINAKQGDSVNIKLKIAHIDEPNWPATPDESYYTGSEPYAVYQSYRADTNTRIFSMPPMKINKFGKYLKMGNNAFQVWGVISSATADNDLSNDTIYYEFNIFLGSSIAYDGGDTTWNDVPKFTGVPGSGLRLFVASNGDDYFENEYLTATKGSGSITFRFDISETDTIYGFQVYWGSNSTKDDEISFGIIAVGPQPGGFLQGSLLNKNRGFDDIRQGTFFDEYVTYLLPVPIIIKPYDNYWAEVSQLSTRSFEIGANSRRMGFVTTSFWDGKDSLHPENDGVQGYNLLLERNLRKFNMFNNLIITLL